MFELLEAYGLLGIQHVASVILGFVRTKILAVTLGPYGVGILAQANVLFGLIQGLTLLGLSGGFTKLIALYHSQSDHIRLNKTIITLISLYAVSGILTLGVSIAMAVPLANWVFADSSLGFYIIMVVAAGMMWIQYQVVLLIFRALLKWREYSLASTLGYIINIFIAVVLIYLAGLNGAVWSIFIAQILNCLIAYMILLKRVASEYNLDFWKHAPDMEALRQLAPYLAPTLFTQALATFATVYIRSDLVHLLGAAANGLYQVLWGISMAYMGFIFDSIFTYGVPKISAALNDPEEAIRVQNYGIRLLIMLLSPLTMLLIASREIWIPLLFSPVFISAGSLLVWQFGADILRMIQSNLNVVLIPLKRLRFLWISGSLYWGGWIVLAAYMIPRMGIAAVPVSYFIVNAFYTIVSYIYHKLTTPFRVYPENVQLILKTIPLLTVGYLISYYLANLWIRSALCLLVLVIMATWLPTRSEITKVFGFLSRLNIKSSSK